jgi:AsmA protein
VQARYDCRRSQPRWGEAVKVIKILLAIVGALAVLAVAAAALLIAFFEPNDYKGFVTSWVEERTGRPFTIDGDLELTLFPWLAVETQGVTLGNPEGFDDAEPFATVERVAAGIRLLPLLERRFEVGSVRIDGMRLNLERRADGRGNWEDFAARAPGGTDAGGSAASAPQVLRSLDIEGIEIRGGEVHWREAGRRLRYIASGIRVATGSIRAGEPVQASLAVRIADIDSARTFDVDAQSAVAVAALGYAEGDAALVLRGFELGLTAYDADMRELSAGRLSAELFRAWQDGRVDAGAARLDARVTDAPAVPAGLGFGAEWAAMSFDPGAGGLAFDGLSTRVADVTASWQLAVRNLIDAPDAQGTLHIVNAPIGTALATFGVAMPAGVEPRALGTLDAAAQFRITLSLHDGDGAGGPVLGPYRLDALRVADLEASLLGAALAGTAELGDDGVVRSAFDVPSFAPNETLRSIVAAHAPAGLDPSAIDRLAFSGRAEIDSDNGRVALRAVRAALLGAELFGTLDAAAASGGAGPTLRGTLRTSQLDSARLAQLLGSLTPASLDPAQLGSISIDTRFDYTPGRLQLDALTLAAFGMQATGRASVTGFDQSPTASGELRIAQLSPRELLQRFSQPVPETFDPTALTRASLTARFDANAESVRLRDMDLALDDTRITGELAVQSFDAPTYRFSLAIDGVNVDRYLPPRTSDLPDDAGEDAMTAGDIELPADALRNLRIDGRVSVNQMRLAGLDFADVATGIAVGGGRASLDGARANLYGGTFEGSFQADTSGEPGLRLAGRATSLNLEPLITALTGDANFSGIGDFDLDLSGRGATVIANVESANGNVTFSMRDGAIDGFNLGRALCVVYNATQRLPAPAEQPALTQYQQIRGTANVRNGVASSSDLLARASFLDLTGAGRLTLTERRLDYSLEATLTGSTGIRGCDALDGLVGESLPLTLRGTVTDPEIRPDFSAIIERRLRDAVRDRVQDRLQDRLRDLLR